ncbi:hypothetical protein [Bacillus sp. UMB0728]|uniref:hypothetical protein n=1 Tax=Bacillus sp. UMB0728 TaxID=2066052 RepID=UPI000C76EAC5|nr:hypothetical protein [Bacillus sp. UMB0728]PLR74841.1 hypothetical protein CYJ37_04290 [Bacillus sp. UMB0728]
MRKNLLLFCIPAAFVLLYFIVSFSFGEEKFDEVLAKEDILISDIESIEIISGWKDERKYLTGRQDIQRLMENFTGLKMNKNNFAQLSDEDSYWLTISSKSGKRLALTIFESDYITVYSFQDKNSRSNTYKLSHSGLKLSLEEIFK